MILRNWLSLTSIAVAAVVLLSAIPLAAEGQESSAEESSKVTETGLIDFARDVQPIFSQKCLRCHGPDEAKNDFRVDEAESVLTYVEPGDASASSLWGDYLTTDEDDMRMPPASDKQEDVLTGSELATIKLWIEEGAKWSEMTSTSEPVVAAPPASLLARIWQFQGLFHPATTHLPVALLTVSAGFVFLSFFNRESCEPVAYHCLWIGALGAITAVLAGWSYAVHEGYGEGFSFDFAGSAIDRHRWLGVAVAVLSVLLIPMAAHVRRSQDMGMRFMWLLGSLIMLGAVGTVGYQGGELTYGEGHYENEFIRLFPEVASSRDSDEVIVEEQVEPSTQKVDDTSASSLEGESNTSESAEQPDNPAPVEEGSPAATESKEQ